MQVAKRMLHRSMLIHYNPHLKIIDGITITEDEKVKARLLHAESPQQVVGCVHESPQQVHESPQQVVGCIHESPQQVVGCVHESPQQVVGCVHESPQQVVGCVH